MCADYHRIRVVTSLSCFSNLQGKTTQMYVRIALSENCNECCGLLLYLFPRLKMPRGNLDNHHWHQGVYSLLVLEQIKINQNSG